MSKVSFNTPFWQAYGLFTLIITAAVCLVLLYEIVIKNII